MRTVIALSILLLGKVAHSQAPFPATCELIIWNYCALSNGGFSNDDCLNTYCNLGSCNPKCCSLPTKQEQVNCLNKGAGGRGPAPPPSPPKNDQCDQMLGRIEGCERQTPSFDQLAPTAQANCLCIGGLGRYDPAPFDDSASSCYEWAKVSYTAFATSLENVGVVGFCTAHSPPGVSAGDGAVPSTVSGGSLGAPTSGIMTTPVPTASNTGGAVTNAPSSSTKSSAAPVVRGGAGVLWVCSGVLLSFAACVLNGLFLSG